LEAEPTVLDGHARARFHRLRVREVVAETDDAVTVALDIPPEIAGRFAYRAGQFVNVRVVLDGEPLVRSYSMSSTPGIDEDLRITVKRVPGGVVSNRLVDTVRPAGELEVTPPSGLFVLDDPGHDVVAIAAGSGITPVFSLLRTVLLLGTGRVALLYANRDRSSTIFAGALDLLAAEHPGRFRLVHHLDVDAGLVSPGRVTAFAAPSGEAQVFVCGPDAFMAIVLEGLRSGGVADARIHLERFTPLETVVAPTAAVEAEVTIRLGGRAVTVPHRPGTTLLQTARSGGLRAPSSCEGGTCATCMARVTAGKARMRSNDALTDDEVAEGWVLTCQAEPVTPTITVEYE
jgi:ferredoxin-NADP reductase